MDYSPGLRGVVAGETEISTVGMEGTSLRYRGYDAIELTKTQTYEDVASLIIDDNLDGKLFKETFTDHYENLLKDEDLIRLIANLKVEQHPMDVMRTGTSMLGNIEPEGDFSNQLNSINRMIATMPSIVTYWY